MNTNENLMNYRHVIVFPDFIEEKDENHKKLLMNQLENFKIYKLMYRLYLKWTLKHILIALESISRTWRTKLLKFDPFPF